MHIPFVDLKAQYLSIKNEIDTAIAKVIDETSFIGGEPVKKFEAEFAAHTNVKHCISCANGTDSIEILLKAFGIGDGDEVIVPAISWISTSEAVSAIGAVPVFVDIEPNYYTIDHTKIEAKITKSTKAIIPVHLYGHPASMLEIMAIAKKYNLIVIEDCAQSHDAEVNGIKVGNWGQAASYSFYPGKNLGAYGDAGCMTTNNDEIAAKSRMIANHGQIKKHHHLMEGRNSRLDSLQAAILSAKLPYLKKWTNARIENAAYYNSKVTEATGVTPSVRENSKHVFHLYVVRVKERPAIIEMLKQSGVESAIHYPTALPFLPCYTHQKNGPKDFPVAHQYQNEILSLPLYPELTKIQMDYVIESLNKVIA